MRWAIESLDLPNCQLNENKILVSPPITWLKHACRGHSCLCGSQRTGGKTAGATKKRSAVAVAPAVLPPVLLTWTPQGVEIVFTPHKNIITITNRQS